MYREKGFGGLRKTQWAWSVSHCSIVIYVFLHADMTARKNMEIFERQVFALHG